MYKISYDKTFLILTFIIYIFSGTQITALSDDLLAQIVNNNAVIIFPVADMNNSFPPPDHPAASPETKSCRRAHQALYNELVTCIEENDDAVHIACENAVYGLDPILQKPLNTFWINKNDTLALKTVEDRTLLHAIPDPRYGYEPTIVLTYPWKQFSLGTRFKHLPDYDTQSSYAVTYADFANNTLIVDYIPHQQAIVEENRDPQTARALFVTLINNLLDTVTPNENSEYVIPFVWGGSSFTKLYARDEFYKQDELWHRNDDQQPYSGYDCSEFILRMAQIAGINFPWKTSYMIQHSLNSLQRNDVLKEGDIIWTQGGVLIISNIAHNEIIEARGYSSGYGCVHRSTLQKTFKEVATYDDLLERYHHNQSITYQNKDGSTSPTSHQFKILKLVS